MSAYHRFNSFLASQHFENCLLHEQMQACFNSDHFSVSVHEINSRRNAFFPVGILLFAASPVFRKARSQSARECRWLALFRSVPSKFSPFQEMWFIDTPQHRLWARPGIPFLISTAARRSHRPFSSRSCPAPWTIFNPVLLVMNALLTSLMLISPNLWLR